MPTRKGINEFRVKVTVKNNLLLSAIEAAGYGGWGGLARFARDAGLHPTHVSELISLRRPPIGDSGEFIEPAKVIMEVLGACPSDLWTDAQLMMRIKRNSSEITMGADAVQAMLENHVTTMTLPDPYEATEKKEIAGVVAGILSKLTKKQERILRLKFGIGDTNEREHTYEEIGKQFDVTRERIRQIEARALRNLRDPSKSESLREFVEDAQ